MQSFWRAVFLALLALAASAACANDYEVGQIWSYRARPQDPASALMILHIDKDTPRGEVIVIRIVNVNFQSANGKMVVLELNPPPFRPAALDRSVIKITGKADKLNWNDKAYRNWRQALSEGKNVPLYDKPVAAVVSELETKMVGNMKAGAGAKKQSQ